MIGIGEIVDVIGIDVDDFLSGTSFADADGPVWDDAESGSAGGGSVVWAEAGLPHTNIGVSNVTVVPGVVDVRLVDGNAGIRVFMQASWDFALGDVGGTGSASILMPADVRALVALNAQSDPRLALKAEPRIEVQINGPSLALVFSASVLRPTQTQSGDDIGTAIDLGFLALRFSTLDGVDIEGCEELEVPQSWIGNTGLTIEAQGVKPKFRADAEWPELLDLGLPGGEKGVYIGFAGIGLPPSWTPNDAGGIGFGVEKAFIGTGGFTGTVKMYEPFDAAVGGKTPIAAADGSLWKGKAGGFEVTLDKFDVEFFQNAITEAEIGGELTIPGIGGEDPTKVSIIVDIDGSGEFSVVGRPPSNKDFITTLEIGKLASLNLKTVTLGKEKVPGSKDRFYLDLAGSMKIHDPATPGVELVEAPVERLRVYSDGAFEFVGGVNLLKTKFDLNVGPARVTVSSLTIGSHEKGRIPGVRYSYISFDGTLSTGNGGVDARAKGIKINCPMEGAVKPSDVYFTIEGLGIHMQIPGNVSPKDAAVILNGYIESSDEADARPSLRRDGRHPAAQSEHLRTGGHGPHAEAAGVGSRHRYRGCAGHPGRAEPRDLRRPRHGGQELPRLQAGRRPRRRQQLVGVLQGASGGHFPREDECRHRRVLRRPRCCTLDRVRLGQGVLDQALHLPRPPASLHAPGASGDQRQTPRPRTTRPSRRSRRSW